MKRAIVAVVLLLAAYSCQKTSQLQDQQSISMQMKNDPAVKSFFFAAWEWVEQVSPLLPTDSSSIVTYLSKSVSTNALIKRGAAIREKYGLDQYPTDQARQIVKEVFRSFMEDDRKKAVTSRSAAPMTDDPASFPPKTCYQYLIEDVSECDREMVEDTGLALLGGALTGFVGYILGQTAAFIAHSRCVDDAHDQYDRCKAKESIYYPDKNDLLIDTTLVFPTDPNIDYLH